MIDGEDLRPGGAENVVGERVCAGKSSGGSVGERTVRIEDEDAIGDVVLEDCGRRTVFGVVGEDAILVADNKGAVLGERETIRNRDGGAG